MKASDHPPIAYRPAGHSEEQRVFLQERLGLFAKWIFILAGSFYLLATTLVADVAVLLKPYFLFHLGGTLVIGAVWAATRLRVLSPRTLVALDAGGLVATGALFAGFAGSFARDHISAGLDPRIGLSMGQSAGMALVLARAVIVPSTATRTFWLSTVALIPLSGLAAWVLYTGPPLPRTPGVKVMAPPELVSTVAIAGWSAAAVAIGTIGSRVIFGLRTEVGKVKQLGQYALDEKIGEGGMGIVYRASHAMLRRPTAIKLLPPERAGEDAIRRFEREVQITAGLSHPSTIAVFDYGRTPAGVFYYAMEYLEGLNLQQLIERDGPQPPGRVIHVLEQVSGALTEAHEVGLIHRDIKPANVILCERGGMPDVAKVLDFGLVRQIAATGSETTVQTTAANILAGTPLYMPPESLKGEQFVDGRSDLYALGAVGYFLLTGTPVFPSGTVAEAIVHHLQATPVPPSRRTGRPVPADLEAVIMRCLEKDPAARFSTARDLAHALRMCARTSPWRQEDAAEWWARFRTSRAGKPAPPVRTERAPTIAVDIEEASRVRRG